MSFDKKAFLQAQWKPRTDTVKLPGPEFKKFFDGKTEWRVRGLEGVELGRVKDAAQRNRDISKILAGLVSASDKERISSLRKLVGVDDSVPDGVAKRIEIFIIGSLEDDVDLALSKAFCKAFPIEFEIITDKILELTGAGHVPGKAEPSGKRQKSKQA